MPVRFRTVLFDLDGTLIDHFTAIHRCHAHTLAKFGLPDPGMPAVRRAVGLGLEHAILTLVGHARAELVPKAVPVYREHWARTMLDDVTVLPGAHEILGALRAAGVRCSVLTNKHGPSSRAVCDKLGLTPLLDRVVGAMDTPWLKPEPALTKQVLGEIGASAGSTLFVGDSPYDILTARNAGMPAWVVTTGTHSAGELLAAGADVIHDGLPAVQAALLRVSSPETFPQGTEGGGQRAEDGQFAG